MCTCGAKCKVTGVQKPRLLQASSFLTCLHPPTMFLHSFWTNRFSCKFKNKQLFCCRQLFFYKRLSSWIGSEINKSLHTDSLDSSFHENQSTRLVATALHPHRQPDNVPNDFKLKQDLLRSVWYLALVRHQYRYSIAYSHTTVMFPTPTVKYLKQQSRNTVIIFMVDSPRNYLWKWTMAWSNLSLRSCRIVQPGRKMPWLRVVSLLTAKTYKVKTNNTHARTAFTLLRRSLVSPH